MAARNFGRVNVSISASTGGLTRGLGDASKQMRGFKAQTTSLSATLQNSVAGFVGLGRGATVAAIGVRALGMAIKSLLGPLIVITSLASIFSAIGRAATNLDAAAKLARRLGMSASSIQAFSTVASEAGVSSERLNVMLTFMSRQLGLLAQGNAQAEKAFGLLGLKLADLANLSPEEQFTLISQRIQALPNQSQRAAVAMMLFGRSGAEGLNFIAAAAGGAVTEMQQLQQQLGVSLTDTQIAGIEMMNDALARTSMVFEGFINQLLAGLAPAITTVANLFVSFAADAENGFSVAGQLAEMLTARLRNLAGAVTFVYGVFQVLSSFVGVFIQVALKGFEGVTWAIQHLIGTMAAAAEALPGFEGVAESLRNAEQYMSELSTGAGSEAAAWGQAAAENFEKGVENIQNPFAAFDAEMADVQKDMQEAGAQGGAAAASEIAQAIGASSKDLKAIVAGTTAGEAFRNSILRGADPRLEGDKDAQRTADATERTADAAEGLAATMGGLDGLGVATIQV